MPLSTTTVCALRGERFKSQMGLSFYQSSWFAHFFVHERALRLYTVQRSLVNSSLSSTGIWRIRSWLTRHRVPLQHSSEQLPLEQLSYILLLIWNSWQASSCKNYLLPSIIHSVFMGRRVDTGSSRRKGSKALSSFSRICWQLLVMFLLSLYP